MTIEEKYNWLLSKLSCSYDCWENDGLLVMKGSHYFQSSEWPTVDVAIEQAIYAEGWKTTNDNTARVYCHKAP